MEKMKGLKNRLEAELPAMKMSQIEIDLKFLNQITCPNFAWTPQIVNILVSNISKRYQLDETNQFQVVRDIEGINTFLDARKFQNLTKMPMFFLYQNLGHWVNFNITQSVQRSDVKLLFYRDASKSPIPVLINEIIKRNMPMELKICDVSEENMCKEDHVNCGLFSLNALETIIRSMKTNSETLFENFETLQFSKLKDAYSIRSDFRVDLVEPEIHKLLKSFKPSTQSKQEFINLIQFVAKCENNLKQPVDSYVYLLKNEMTKQEKDPEYQLNVAAIQEAKAKIMNIIPSLSTEIENSKNMFKEIMPEYKPNDVQNLENNNNSPQSINDHSKYAFSLITKIFSLLNNTVETPKLANLLKIIGLKLGIEPETLLTFFKAKDQISQRFPKNDPNLQLQQLTMAEILEKLPEPIQSKHQVSNVSSVKTLNRLLAEMSLGREFSQGEIRETEPNEVYSFFKSIYSSNEHLKKLEKKFKTVQDLSLNIWKHKSIEEIHEWAVSIRNSTLSTTNSNLELEAIAIMNRAFELITGGYTLRTAQILAVLDLLSKDTSQVRGKLCEISTGEGKTIIIAFLAAIKVLLQRQNVDIITSNQVLATECVESTQLFYNILNLTVATNNVSEDENKQESKSRDCYKADIVYGSISAFQFDYLKHSFEAQGTKGERTFESSCAILDEVDNLSIDNGGNIAKLARTFPGMEMLKYIYIKIWQELAKAEESVAADITTKLESKAKELQTQLEAKGEEIIQKEYETYELELLSGILKAVKNSIIKSNPTDIRLIPKHLKVFCQTQINKWVDNALRAKYDCHENENYVIKPQQETGEDCVIPVDYQNTGVTLKNTMWSHGLHQFVQLKHNLELTSENLASSFISNIGYIKLYNNNFLGVTGTLGSKAEMDFFSTAYNVEFGKIPRFKPNLLLMFEDFVVEDNHWLNFISIESFILALERRSVLIICKTIKDLKLLEKNIKSVLEIEGEKDIKIKLYADEDGSKVVCEKVRPGEIIIATNIAGRGTDFKISKELEAKGGLHVVVSFLPCNQRVQDQAFGRTARKGKVGSAQLILSRKDIQDLGMDFEQEEELTIEKILHGRDKLETCRLSHVKNEKLPEINFKDGIFSKFSTFYKEFKTTKNKNLGGLFLCLELKELWAFWFENQSYKRKPLNEIDKMFQEFKIEVDEIVQNSVFISNPYYCIRQAECFIQNNNIPEAEQSINQALALSGPENACLLYSAHLKMFEIQIEKGAQLLERFKKALGNLIFINVKKDEEYKDKAKEALQNAISALEMEIFYMESNFFDGVNSNEEALIHERAVVVTYPNPIILKSGTLEAGFSPSNHPIGYAHANEERENDVTEIENNDFQRIIVKQEGNVLLKHLTARYIALSTFHKHAESLLQNLEASFTQDSSKGISINTRLPYLKQLNDRNPEEKMLKDSFTENSVTELESIGLETIYSLREVHDASEKVILGAQIQIASGIASLAAGCCFLPALPVLGPIAGALISEGICDIVIELLSKGQSDFNMAEYVKGKVISYGIALGTMGISAIATSTKLLNSAASACRKLSSLLRKCPHLQTVCKKLATKLDKVAKYFDKLAFLKEFNKLAKVDQLQRLKELKAAGKIEKLKKLGGLSRISELEHLKSIGKIDIGISRLSLLKSSLISVGKNTALDVVMTVVSEKVVTAGLMSVLDDLKPLINSTVRDVIENDSDLIQKLKIINRENFGFIVHSIFYGNYGEIAGDILLEIALGVIRHSQNWKVKITGLVIDSAIAISKYFQYTKKFLDKFKTVEIAVSLSTNNEQIINEMKENLIAQISEKIFSVVIQLAGKYANTLVVSPILKTIRNSSYRKKKTLDMDAEEIKTLTEITDAYNTVGAEPGSSLDEITKMYRKTALQNHPDKPGGSAETMQLINNAFKLIKTLHEEVALSYTGQKHEKLLLSDATLQPLNLNKKNGASVSGVNISSDLTSNGHLNINSAPSSSSQMPAHQGNIKTLSKKLEREIIVRVKTHDNEVETLRHFGKKFSENGKTALEIVYFPPTKVRPLGHYDIPEEHTTKLKEKGIDTTMSPSGENNCLYDALALLLNVESDYNIILAIELRYLAEQFNLANLSSNIAIKSSSILNNRITQAIHIQALSNLLVGGAISDNFASKAPAVRTFRDRYINELKQLNLPQPKFTPIALDKLCRNNAEAIEKVKKSSPKYTERTKNINLYTISNFDELTSFIINYDVDHNSTSDHMPFGLNFPNGNTVVFRGDLYATFAYNNSSPKTYLESNQYRGDNLGDVLTTLQCLVDPAVNVDIKNLPEICGRLISEPIRNKSTFVSACLALINNPNSPLTSENPTFDHNQLVPVSSATGIQWAETDDSNVKNPCYLLGYHLELFINRGKKNNYNYNTRMYELAEMVRKRCEVEGGDSKEYKEKYYRMFYRKMYETVKSTLEDYASMNTSRI